MSFPPYTIITSYPYIQMDVEEKMELEIKGAHMKKQEMVKGVYIHVPYMVKKTGLFSKPFLEVNLEN